MNAKLIEILKSASENIPYYQMKYSKIDFTKKVTIESIPLINTNEYWKEINYNKALQSGIVFKSGGSTGSPKYSYFTHKEWLDFTRAFGLGISKGIISNNDRIANLFYAGDMYASFLFIKDSLQSIENLSLTQFPISGSCSFENILKTIEEFDINVLCGVPTHLLGLMEFYTKNIKSFKKVKIEKILFGGEALYSDQLETFNQMIPQLEISSVGCASVDGGLIGYSSKDCNNFEHRVFSEDVILEILDPDTFEKIEVTNKVGKIYITNLKRKLMPIIRYPSGDMGMWIENKEVNDRKFKLCGRADEAARVGTLSVYVDEIRDIIVKAFPNNHSVLIQLIIHHFDNKDELIIKIHGLDSENEKLIQDKIVEQFSIEKKNYVDILTKNLIHPLKINIVKMEDLEINSRTGKLKRIIDKRI